MIYYQDYANSLTNNIIIVKDEKIHLKSQNVFQYFFLVLLCHCRWTMVWLLYDNQIEKDQIRYEKDGLSHRCWQLIFKCKVEDRIEKQKQDRQENIQFLKT